jgi:hypothetical protein
MMTLIVGVVIGCLEVQANPSGQLLSVPTFQLQIIDNDYDISRREKYISYCGSHQDGRASGKNVSSDGEQKAGLQGQQV